MSPDITPAKHEIQLGEDGNDTFYVQDSDGTWQPLNYFEFFRVKKAMNQVSEFEVKIFDIQDTQKAYLKRGALVLFLTSKNVVLKGRLQSVEYATAFECVATGFGMESLLLDQEFIKNNDKKVTYDDPTSAQTIAKEMLSEGSDGVAPWIIQPATTGLFDTDYGNVVLNFESVTRLKALNTLSEAMASPTIGNTGYEWWISIDDDDYDIVYFNIAPARPTTTRATTSQLTFRISGASANATKTSKSEDITNMVNSITVVGRTGNTGSTTDVNTTTYSASTSFSTLSAEITDSVTTIVVEDHDTYSADDFVTGGGTIRIAGEQITYAAYNATTWTFTGCTRGANLTTARKHKKGCYVEEYHAQTSPETGSSIEEHGIFDHTVIDKGIVDISEAELLASNLLLERKDPIISIQVSPYEPQTIVGSLDIGDLVTVIDDEADINDSYRIQSIEYKSDYGTLNVILELSNRSLSFVEQLNNQRVTAEQLARFATSSDIISTNITGNCEGYSTTNAADYPLNMFFYVPEIVAVNQALLTFDIGDFRSYSSADSPTGAGSAHTHTDTFAVDNDTHDHDFTGTTETSGAASAAVTGSIIETYNSVTNVGDENEDGILVDGFNTGPNGFTNLAHTHDTTSDGTVDNDTHNHNLSGSIANESTHTHTISSTVGITETSSGVVAVLFGVKGSEIPIGTASESGTADAGGGNAELVDATKTWVVDEYADYVVYISAGTGSGQTRFVSSNTADTLTLEHDWTTNPDATSTYDIYPTFTTSQSNVDIKTEVTAAVSALSSYPGLVNLLFLPKDGDLARIEAHTFIRAFT